MSRWREAEPQSQRPRAKHARSSGSRGVAGKANAPQGRNPFSGPQGPTKSSPAAALALLLSSALLLAAGCGEAPARNVLLIVSDTLRADALDCYGGPARTPHICDLAERGVRFERARSNGPWTLPSSVSLFTGQYASEHGHEARGDAATAFYYVAEEEELLAEQLKARGYTTRAYIENQLARSTNALQGFDVVELHELALHDPLGIGARFDLDVSVRRELRMLPVIVSLMQDPPVPFFTVQWIMDPHAIYSPPQRFFSRIRVDRSRLPRKLSWYSRLEASGDSARDTRDLSAAVESFSAYEHEMLRALYHREVESVDHRVGALLAALEAGGAADDTLVIFTADHGEGFGEHGRFLHAGKWLYDEFLRIPLIVAGPGVPGGRVSSLPVSLVDLVPTLREWLGLPASAHERGRSLAGLLRGDSAPDDGTDRAPYAVDRSVDGVYDALIVGRYKAIGRGDRTEIYDLEADPGERHDLASERPELATRLRARIDDRRADDDERRRDNVRLAPSDVLDEASRATLEQLRALGYVDAEARTER